MKITETTKTTLSESQLMKLYSDAITIIMSPDVDYREIVIQIAKNNPKAIIDAVESPWDNVKKRASEIAKTEGKVPAIKFLRMKSRIMMKRDMELQEAKDLIESLVKPNDFAQYV